MTGYVDNEAWNYFNVRTFSMNPIVISVAQTSTHAGADCDVFVKKDAKPSRFEFDYQDIGLATSFNITVPQPGQGTWWIGVYGFSKCEFRLSVRLDHLAQHLLERWFSQLAHGALHLREWLDWSQLRGRLDPARQVPTGPCCHGLCFA